MFFRNTDSILKQFTKAIDQLEAHSAARSAAAEHTQAQINKLALQRLEHQDEAVKAAGVASKLRKLFG